jgi:hypothetical protein
VPAVNVTLHANYEMEHLGENSTLLRFDVNWLDSKLPAENKQGMMAGQMTNFELFKRLCETSPG